MATYRGRGLRGWGNGFAGTVENKDDFSRDLLKAPTLP
jgi:hypothetical protein